MVVCQWFGFGLMASSSISLSPSQNKHCDGLWVRFPWCFRWQYPRRLWSVRWLRRLEGLNREVAVSSSSWAELAYCPVYTDSSLAADEIWSLDTILFSSRSFPSWWRLRTAKASGDGEKLSMNTPINHLIWEASRSPFSFGCL